MLKLINRKRTLQWILFTGLLALSLISLIKTQLPNPQGTAFLFQYYVHIFLKNPFLGKGIIIAVLLLQIVFLQYYFRKNEYAPKKTLLPACFYLSILLITRSLSVISPLFFTTLFFLATISIDLTVTSAKLKNNVFWTGILIAVATGFDPSSIILLLLVIATLFINQYFKIKETGILLFGFLLVYFYFFSYYFFINQLDEWLLTFQQFCLKGILCLDKENLTYKLISLLSLGIIFIYFIIRIRLVNESKVVKQRIRVYTFNTCSVFMLGCFFITNSTYPIFSGYIFAPLSIYLSLMSLEKNPFFINELITLITLLLLWV